MTVYFFLVLQVLLSSGTHIVAKAVSADVEPISLTFLRGLISMVAFAAIILLRRRRHIDRQDYGRFFLLAIIAVPINQFLFLYGIHYTTAGNAALLYATTPAFVFLISRYVLKEFLSTRVVVGIFLAFCGAVVVIFERGLSLSSSYTYGNMMIFLAVISWAIYTVAGKPMVIKYGAFQVTAISMIGGTLLFLPVGVYGLATFDVSALTVQDWSGLFYLGWATSILSYVLWFYAVGRLATAKVAIFSNAQPIVTTLLSFLILHQPIGASVITGGVLTIAGVAIAQQERPHPRPEGRCMSESSPRILVVEDNAIVAYDLSNMLKALHYQVIQIVSTGEEAMYCAGMLNPDLVLLDIGLEGAFDGISVAEEIRATLNIPVVFVTAFADAETLQRAKITEPFGYIIKPFQREELHRTIEMAMYKDRSDRMVHESQERYSLAVRGANDGIWDWNLRTGEIYFSSRWKEIIGYNDADPFTVEKWKASMHPEDAERVWREYDNHLAGNTPRFEVEYRILHKDGSFRWVLGKGVCLRNLKGVPYRIAGSQTDISRRKKEQEARERLITELRDALGNVRKLSGLLPICASCKKIRDDEGYWNQVETYLMEHTSVQFTHGICPECSEKLYPR